MATADTIATNTGIVTKVLQNLRIAGLFVLQGLVRVSDLFVPKSFSRVETTPFIDPPNSTGTRMS